MTPATSVTIRPVEDADLPILYEHRADPIAIEMAVVPARTKPEFMAQWASIRADGTGVARAIVADGAVVGMVLSWVTDEGRMVGYWIGREHWGQGYATRGLALLVAEIAERPLIANVADSNIGSRRVLEHCGFVRVGGGEADGVRESTYRLD
jgi:RimJ/RimL family protein N-acetyltransferase